MEVTTLAQTAANLALSVAYALVTVVLAVGTLVWVDRVIYRHIDFVQEMKNGNVAATIFYCALLLFIGVIRATAGRALAARSYSAPPGWAFSGRSRFTRRTRRALISSLAMTRSSLPVARAFP